MGMGKALNTSSSGLTVPQLADAMGYTHTRLYQLIRAGRGPALTDITLSPLSSAHGRRERYVRWQDAVAWLEARHDAPRWADVIRILKLQYINQYLRAGLPLPRPAQTPYVSPYRRPGARAEPPPELPTFSTAMRMTG
jgi:hypothetical protein